MSLQRQKQPLGPDSLEKPLSLPGTYASSALETMATI